MRTQPYAKFQLSLSLLHLVASKTRPHLQKPGHRPSKGFFKFSLSPFLPFPFPSPLPPPPPGELPEAEGERGREDRGQTSSLAKALQRSNKSVLLTPSCWGKKLKCATTALVSMTKGRPRRRGIVDVISCSSSAAIGPEDAMSWPHSATKLRLYRTYDVSWSCSPPGVGSRNRLLPGFWLGRGIEVEVFLEGGLRGKLRAVPKWYRHMLFSSRFRRSEYCCCAEIIHERHAVPYMSPSSPSFRCVFMPMGVLLTRGSTSGSSSSLSVRRSQGWPS